MSDDAGTVTTAEPEGAPEGQPLPNTAGHDAKVPSALAQFMAQGWAPVEDPEVPAEPSAPYTAKRREALSARFPGEVLVVPTGTWKVRANDTDYPFRAGSDFYWLTGDLEPDDVLVLAPEGDGHRATLYMPPRADRSGPAFFTDRRYGELWVGARRGLRETSCALSVETAALAGLPDALAALRDRPVRVLRDVDARVDALVPVQEPASAEPVAGAGEVGSATDGTPAADHSGASEEHTAPAAEDASAPEAADAADAPSATDAAADAAAATPDGELAAVLSELRLVKDDHEVAMLEEAVAATVRGFEDVVRELPHAVATSERWIEGTFDRRARVEGNDVGYGSICACGPHATTLHWVRNDGAVRPGELMLLDMGVESRSLYTADITRTLPISGRWTPAQRRVYEVVLAAQRAGLQACRPGAEFLDPHRAAMRVIAAALAEWGLLPVSAEESLTKQSGLHGRYTLHSTSHMLGIDVHDCASARTAFYKGTLEPGYVITVEPGLYFQPDDLTVPAELRGIGVRIEDDVLITVDGYRVLSCGLPTDPDEVETWMARLLPAG